VVSFFSLRSLWKREPAHLAGWLAFLVYSSGLATYGVQYGPRRLCVVGGLGLTSPSGRDLSLALLQHFFSGSSFSLHFGRL
jgi:hypothetical protein